MGSDSLHNYTSFNPIRQQRAMAGHWIRPIRVLKALQSNTVTLNFMQYFQIKLSAESVEVAWQFCTRAAYFVSPPCCAVTCYFALLQGAGFWRPMKSHLALAPEYTNTTKIDLMACHIRVRMIFWKFSIFIPCVPHCD